MFKKIQQYLLIHHPLLWNLKFIPILICGIVLNIIFYSLGYFSTNFSIKDSLDYSYSSDSSLSVFYFCAVVTGILLLIFWLTSYSKNNAFKIFYPKTSDNLYKEWILSLVLIFTIVLFPFSCYKGINDKYRSSVSKSDMIEAINILNMVDLLMPDSKNNYYKEYPDGYTQQREEKGDISLDNPKKDDDDSVVQAIIDETKYVPDVIDPNQTFEDYPNFTQLSLLNYNVYNYGYVPSDFRLVGHDHETVINWLENQDKEKIKELMDSFMKLQEKHGLKSNLTRDKWFELVYNPQKYPVGDFNLIHRQNTSSYNYYSSYNYSGTDYYLQYDELDSGYNIIMHAYEDEDTMLNVLLTSICVALCISLFVFSFRVTSGKSWLIALVSIGLILILDLLLSIIVGLVSMDSSGLIQYEVVLFLIFISELIYLISKVSNNKSKGRSNIMMNHFVWFIPVIPAIIYSFLVIDSGDNYELYGSFKDSILFFVWGNVALTFVSMWFFTRFLLLKWKGLPED